LSEIAGQTLRLVGDDRLDRSALREQGLRLSDGLLSAHLCQAAGQLDVTA